MKSGKSQVIDVTIISKGMKLSGEIQTISDIRIEGEVNGPIVTIGKVILGEESIVNGDISSRSLELYGKFKGDMLVDEHVIIGSSAVYEGNICCNSIEILKGSTFKGNLHSNVQVDSKKVKSGKDKIANIKSIANHANKTFSAFKEESTSTEKKVVNGKIKNESNENSTDLFNGGW